MDWKDIVRKTDAAKSNPEVTEQKLAEYENKDGQESAPPDEE